MGPEQQRLWGLFLEGMGLLVDNWTAVALAVEIGSVRNAREKKEEFKTILAELFHPEANQRGKVNMPMRNALLGSETELAGFLQAEVESRFLMDIDDDSEIAVAFWLNKLFSSLGSGSVEVLEQIRAHPRADPSKCLGQALAEDTGARVPLQSSSESSDQEDLE